MSFKCVTNQRQKCKDQKLPWIGALAWLQRSVQVKDVCYVRCGSRRRRGNRRAERRGATGRGGGAGYGGGGGQVGGGNRVLSVLPHEVLLEVVAAREATVAAVAAKGFLPGVQREVSLQVTGEGEGARAEGALAPTRVPGQHPRGGHDLVKGALGKRDHTVNQPLKMNYDGHRPLTPTQPTFTLVKSMWQNTKTKTN